MNNITTVYFVRHGETDANTINLVQGQSDVPLNQNGIAQAECVGARLGNMHFDHIYSSDLSRAKYTAQCIAKDREIIYTAQLREWDLGVWEGKLLDEIKVLYPDDFDAYIRGDDNFAVADGESLRDIQRRAADFIQEIARKHPGETVLAVSHGGFIRNILKVVLKIDRFKVRPRVDNTAICCFKTFDQGQNWQLVIWNDSAHLETFTESAAE